jgi:hypothetical protein
MFVEVDSVEKNCPVIINLDQVIEIAPLSAGGCSIHFTYDGDMGTKQIKVKNSYEQFKQFAMQTVSAEDIQARVDQIKKLAK